ncbi:MAG: ABC transporter permease, partial [Bacteroidales bacterium]
YNDKRFFESDIYYADNSIFRIFSFEVLEGDPEIMLDVPFTMVLTEKTAQKYFGDETPVGKIMNWDNKFNYTITGVVKDPPPNSHFTFNVLASFNTFFTYDPSLADYWWGWNVPTYILLRDKTDYKIFEKKFEQFNKQYLGEVLISRGIELKNRLEPLLKIRLHSDVRGGIGNSGNIRIVYALLSVALVILTIACVNFMNLTTAIFSTRIKEVGIRKILGEERKWLVVRFLVESTVFIIISVILAAFIALLALPYFNNLAGRGITINYIEFKWFTISLAGMFVFVTAISGMYPALFLSAINPACVLRGGTGHGKNRPFFRSALVIFQFATSIFLIIFTLTIKAQQKYLENKNLGFKKENILAVALQNEPVRLNLESLKNELLKINGIKSAGASSMVPGEMYLFSSNVYPENFTPDQTITMQNFLVDYGYFNTIGIEIVRGRGFSPDLSTDYENGILINETAEKAFQWDDPIGKKLNIILSIENNQSETSQWEIIGVYKDFHIRSLYSEIEPTFIRYIRNEGPIENRARRLVLELDPDNIPMTISQIEEKWEELFPEIPYNSFFLEEFYDSQHQAEKRLGSIFQAFSILAILISCLGLFGLALYTTNQRTLEIGIRKVAGSSAGSLVVLILRKFLLLTGIANVFAWTAAFLVTNQWLQNYPYAIELKIYPFVFTALLTGILTLLIVSYKSVQAAMINPVESLKYE